MTRDTDDSELAAVLAEIDADLAERAAGIAKRRRQGRMQKRRWREWKRRGGAPRPPGRPPKGADPLPEPEAQMGRPPGLERLGVNVSLRRFYPREPADSDDCGQAFRSKPDSDSA